MNRNLLPLLALGGLLVSVIGLAAFFGVRIWLAPAGAGGMHPAFAGAEESGGLPWPIKVLAMLAMLFVLLGTVRYGWRKHNSPTTNR